MAIELTREDVEEFSNVLFHEIGGWEAKGAGKGDYDHARLTRQTTWLLSRHVRAMYSNVVRSGDQKFCQQVIQWGFFCTLFNLIYLGKTKDLNINIKESILTCPGLHIPSHNKYVLHHLQKNIMRLCLLLKAPKNLHFNIIVYSCDI